MLSRSLSSLARSLLTDEQKMGCRPQWLVRPWRVIERAYKHADCQHFWEVESCEHD